jgi:hypothetical protein
MEEEEENERALQLAGEKDLLAEHIGVYRRGGFQAVLEWRLAGFKQRAAKKYVAPMVRYLEQSYQQRSPEPAPEAR